MNHIRLSLLMLLLALGSPASAYELPWWQQPSHQKTALGIGLAATASYLIYARLARVAAQRATVPEQLEQEHKEVAAKNGEQQEDRWIIFDLGDVLLTTNGFAALREIGLSKFLAYAQEIGTIFELGTRFRRDALFPFLNSLAPRDPNEVNACDSHGNRLPQIMCNWLKGSVSNEQAAQFIENGAEQYAFTSQAEKELVVATATMMFTPEKLINTFDLAPQANELVARYKDRGIRCAILSNMDPQVTRLLQAKFPDFFALFDRVIASGDHGALKPGRSIYEKLLGVIQTPSARCAFVDDRPENIEMAIDVGIYGILCPARDTWLPWKKVPDLLYIQEMLDHWLDHSAQSVSAHA